MGVLIRHAALLLWAVSFFLPTLRLPSGEVVFGYQLVWQALRVLVAFIAFAPIAVFLVASLFTNALFIRELAGLKWLNPSQVPSLNPAWPAVALLLNITVPGKFSHTTDPPPIGLPGLTSLPGYYTWLLAFVLLFVSSLTERPKLFEAAPPLLKRVGLLFAVAVASTVLFAGVALVLK